MFRNFSNVLRVVFLQGREFFCVVVISGRQNSHANDLERMRELGGIHIRQSKKEGDQARNKLQACICAIIWHSFLTETSLPSACEHRGHPSLSEPLKYLDFIWDNWGCSINSFSVILTQSMKRII